MPIFYIIFLCLLINSPLVFACTVQDDAGGVVHLSQPAKRIISLAPDITETLFALGAGSQVAGTMQGSDYPPTAKTLPIVGSYSGIDIEKILSLHPDLVVVWGALFARQIAILKKFHVPVYRSEPSRLEDIPKTMQNLGCLAGRETAGNRQAAQFLQHLASLRRQYAHAKKLSVFYQIGPYALITINQKSWINQVIELCGGRNVFARLVSISPEVSWEAVLLANPQVVINSSIDEQWKKPWQAWKMISAVKGGCLFNVNPDLIERPGPRLLEGVKQMCHDLQLARRA